MMKQVVTIFILFISSCIYSQTVKNEVGNTWATAFFQSFLKDSSSLYFENNYRWGNTPSMQGMYRWHVHGGGEYAATSHWRLGMSLKYAQFEKDNDFYVKPYLQHIGGLFGLRFIKEVAFEWINKSKSDNPNIVVKDLVRWTLRFALEKDIYWKERLIRIGSFYRAFVLLRVGEDRALFNSYPRTIDKTRWQTYAEIETAKHLFFKFYYMRETDYFFLIDEQQYNFVNNILGLELKYVMH